MNITQQNSLLGVLLADAAALGLHWMYDLERLHQVVAQNAEKTPAFIRPDAAHYAGKVGYFAHVGKQAGEQSHYGEAFLLNLGHLATEGEFRVRKFQQAFLSVFGPGGSYSGYIDKPTAVTLKNLQQMDLSLAADNSNSGSGADDQQIPALTPVAALCVSLNQAALNDTVLETAIRVTNNNDLAVACGLYFSRILLATLEGLSIADSFAHASALMPAAMQEKMTMALDMETANLDSAALTLGQSCDLLNTMPLVAYILKHSRSFKEAAEMNILAGGDSCGRSIMLGAIAGAHYGIGTTEGIPCHWLFKLKRQTAIAGLLG